MPGIGAIKDTGSNAQFQREMSLYTAALGITTLLSQSIGYAANITPDFNSGTLVVVGALTGAITVNNPSNVPAEGLLVAFSFVQDGTGGRNVSWGTNYVFPTAWSNTGNTASLKSRILFQSDGTKLVAIGANSWY